MRPTLYICGPITGHEDDALRRFNDASERLVSCGYMVASPLDMAPAGIDWSDAMRICIPEMLKCTGVALLDGWDESKGACIEKALADDLGMPTEGIDTWTRGCR